MIVRTPWLVAFCGLLAGVFVSTSARQAAAPDQPRPTFRTEANYVRVDVFPTKSGTPIADLTREDIEVLENGQPQKIDQFERVVIPSAPQESRTEPNNVAESRALLENSRARVFVVFLDTYHVDVEASRKIRKPLTELLDHLLGPDDLIAVMTPQMSPQDMAFARKTTTIDGFLEKYWHWGERDRATPPDPEDVQYGECYPNVPRNEFRCADQNGIAAEMIDRRHEVRTLGALENLVRYLRGVREERKAILAVSNGWLLFKPNYNLMKPLACEGVPTAPGVVVDPQTGKPTTKGTAQQAASNSCAIDRTTLAQIDNDQLFRDIQDEANRANASFYTIEPRGLAVFDTSLLRQDVPGPAPRVVGALADAPMLKGRTDSLHNLATATDGLAVVSSDLLGGLRRIVDDLSSYYLIGYYSNGKLDGKFHSISVRVRRPGVQVRARRGYLAAKTADVEKTARVAAAVPNGPASAADTEPLAVETALRPLGAFTKEATLRLRSAAGWKDGSQAAVWLVGEFGPADAWNLGAQADVTLSLEGQTIASAHVVVPPGSRHFRTLLSPTSPLQPGEYAVNVLATATSQLATTNQPLSLTVQAAPAASGSLLFRKGPFTGIREVPTADLRFRRSEQMRIEIPAAAAHNAGTARLLDRTGKTMTGVPLAVAFRDEPDGSRWAVTQVPLSPLGPGDYVVEMSVGGQKTLTPFRMVQ